MPSTNPDMSAAETPSAEFLTARQVMSRFGGISQMTLWRWLKDAKMRFPQPVYINRYRYWRRADIEAWEAAQSNSSSTNPDMAHVEALEEENRRMREALEQSVVAIDDWLHQYAGEHCNELSVQDTRRRIFQNGGTLAYIADVQSANRAALKGAQS